MNLQLIKKMCENREGGLKKLAMDINMSEANLHRCLNNNKIQATDLENIATILNVKVGVFFDEEECENAEIQSLRKEINHLKELLSVQGGSDKLFELWTRFMANQKQYHEIMKEMALIYASQKEDNSNIQQ